MTIKQLIRLVFKFSNVTPERRAYLIKLTERYMLEDLSEHAKQLLIDEAMCQGFALEKAVAQVERHDAEQVLDEGASGSCESDSWIFATTYGSYNEGLQMCKGHGGYLTPENYTDKEAFLRAVERVTYKSDSEEPMFTDWDLCFGNSHMSECSVGAEIWEDAAMDEDDRELLEAYQQGYDEKATLDTAQNQLHSIHEDSSEYDLRKELAQQHIEETLGAYGVSDPWSLGIAFDEEHTWNGTLCHSMHMVKHNDKIFVFNY